MTGYLKLHHKFYVIRKYHRAQDVLFCVGFFIYVFSLIMDLSMWTFSEDGGANSTIMAVKILRYLAYAIMAVKIVYDFSIEYKNFAFLVLFAMVTGLTVITSKNSMIAFYFLVILAARGISGTMIIYTAFLAQGVVLVSTVLMSRIGIITDYITNRSGRIRHFLGFQWATTSALIFLYMVFEYIYLKRGRIKIVDYIIINAVSFFLFLMTDSRMSFLIVLAALTFFLLFGRLFERRGRENGRKSITLFGRFAMLVPWIVAIGSIYIHKIYEKGHGMDKINKLLSNRLNYGHKAMDKYGISLFGKKMEWIGYGLNDTGKGEYNYVDCSYLRIAIEYGLIFLVLVLGIYTFVIYKSYKSKETYLAWIIFFILLISITESRLLNFAFNPFLLMAFASLDANKKQIDIRNTRIYAINKQ